MSSITPRHARPTGRGTRLRPSHVLIPALCALLFMVFTAPCPRFTGASNWVLAIGLRVASVSQLDWWSATFRQSFQMIMALGVALFITRVVKSSRYLQSPIGDTAFAPMPANEMRILTTNSGLPVWVGEDAAWDAPLLNTPEFRPKLVLMNSDDVRSGFKIDPSSSASGDRVATTASGLRKSR